MGLSPEISSSDVFSSLAADSVERKTLLMSVEQTKAMTVLLTRNKTSKERDIREPWSYPSEDLRDGN